jgi:hypothetical protein
MDSITHMSSAGRIVNAHGFEAPRFPGLTTRLTLPARSKPSVILLVYFVTELADRGVVGAWSVPTDAAAERIEVTDFCRTLAATGD